MQTRQAMAFRRAFTLIELLVVIAIIAILAAILFPVFGTVQEQTRQTNTLTSLHAIYVGAKLFREDEGHYPSVLFGYVETPDNLPAPTPTPTFPLPPNRPAIGCTPSGSACSPTTADTPIIPMDQASGIFGAQLGTGGAVLNRGYLYHEQVKDYVAFTNSDNVQKKNSDITIAYWPLNSPISQMLGGTAANPIPVTWAAPNQSISCTYGATTGNFFTDYDRDLPRASYAGKAKLFYVKDSMDIGPMLDTNGNIVYQADGVTPKYELHYSPDWTHLPGAFCDHPTSSTSAYVTQLKYANPPADRTIMTYVTQHVQTVNSSKVMVLLLSGTARKMDVKLAAQQLPLNYKP